MGVDLTVVPIRYPNLDWWLAYNRIGLDRSYALFRQFKPFDNAPEAEIAPLPLPPNVKFQWYGDDGLKEQATDSYDTPLTFVYAADFARLKIDEIYPLSPLNRAVIAMMAQLPADTPVVLWWH